ncbi:hypothetical protein LOTGIDRAFT_152913 [Lottia gigantea]|uniref:Gamma-glutamyltransferase n=1 Tax=Lottia gigantea TaxID=225164 RepID=V4ASG3_LOTGI|nr:hypothetical protein LOTGIDRAFT_152913 [Lottia gigantea]ESO97810.1 hypothetical protein LOTGIDRAFT_152913 [Lottia gigantea]
MKIKGGSTVDAAIATLLCVGLANSMSTGIGGGHFMTIYKRTSKKVYTINAREMAPSAATQEMFKTKSSEKGGLAIAVPGQLMGMWQAYKIGGKLPWKDLFKPAISLCKNGIPVSSTLMSAMHSELRKNPPANLRKLFTNPDTKTYYKAGEKMKRPELARTLEAVANEGVKAFYNGSLTDVISKEIKDAGGIITSDDLRNYVATVDDPVSIKLYDGITVYSPPPPSTGAVFQYVLNILNGYKMVPSDFETKTQTLTEHRIIEAFKFAFARRSTLGDPEVGTAEFKHNISQIVSDLTNLNYGETTRYKINDNKTFKYKHYHPAFSLTETHGTTHLSLLGPNGDAVAITSTVNLYFGSDVVGENTGIIYNDEMDDFSTPNTTNYFGVPASPANFIKPMKRPLSSMTPSIAVAPSGDVVMVVGASGGTKITTAVARVVMESLWFKWGIKKSIDYPRLHDQLVPEVCEAERGYPAVVFDGLKGIGHNMTWVGGGSVVQGILQLKPGDITANSDYRKGGKPAGY